ncbi:type VII secretion target [Nocardia cyriacigeorgica]|uniref:type VII secretion target n=1 Tax=Nocardia cyriacigeorgica TaxID=135487 RepID=UPI002457DAF2|nr:type VII secretion target [Nocardia cyriacigeorgica]
MPEKLDLDPAVLRQLAAQHEQVARDTRQWAKQPTDWLAAFPRTYGAIADPVYTALKEYYQAREDAGNALADDHDRTARNLRASADNYELNDEENAGAIRRGGEEVESPTGGGGTQPAPSSPPPSAGGTAPDAPSDGQRPDAPRPEDVRPDPDGTGTTPPPDQSLPGGTAPDQPTADDATATPTPGMPGTGAPDGAGTGAQTPTTGTAPHIPAAASTDSSANSATTPSTAPTGAAAGSPSGAVPPVTAMPGAGVGPVAGAMDDRAATAPPSQAAGRSDASPMAMPMPTPFAAAVAAAKDKAAEPAHVVGDQVDEDLVIARTLLQAVLAAADSSVIGLSWAVSVMRGPAGAGVFITTNEGRGWMPAGMFLPREVSSPWIWDELLGTDERTGSPWEGVTDPARVLVEFGMAWGQKVNAKLSALVSSGPIDPGLRAQLGDVPTQGLVGPSYDLDLREFTPDTADRLGLFGTLGALEHVAEVPDSQVPGRCIELAVDAHLKVGRSAPPVEAMEVRGVRERILALVQAGQQVPAPWWDDLRDADDLLAASMLSRRVDPGRVGLGDLRVDDSDSALRDMVFERRCNELVLLLEGEPTRQGLRDAVYAHEQIVEHPLFVEAPSTVSTVSTADTGRVARPATSTGTVSAPGVSAGPPAGVSGPPPGAVAGPPPVAPPPSRSDQDGV